MFIVTFAATMAVAADLPYKPGELVVRFDESEKGLTQAGMAQRAAARNAILAAAGGGSVSRMFKRLSGLTVVKLPVGISVQDAVKSFNKTQGILYAEPNYKYKLFAIPNDSRFSELWGMHNTGQTGGTADADVDAPEAWDISTGSENIVVAVTDTGIDYSHPDLAANMWVNPDEIAGNGLDDDLNGYVDDIYGYDFAGPNSFDSNDGDNDPCDYYFHGTHVAGTIGAVGDNSIGVAGVCWNVRIMALKIFADDDLVDPDVFLSDAIAAIEYAVDNDANVINASWGGGPFSQFLYDAIADAGVAGVLFVAAAGNNCSDNDSSPHYPSNYDLDNIISVMATDHNDDVSSFSNYGAASVDIGAPGTSVLSTFPTYMTAGMQAEGFSTDYETISGTSMAAPHVSGACALVWSYEPNLTHTEIKEMLLSSVDPTLQGLCVSGGRLNLFNALSLVTVPDVVGLAQADAEFAVTSIGLIVGQISYKHSKTVPEGSVISQNPAAGAYAIIGSEVDLVISIGPYLCTPENALLFDGQNDYIDMLYPGPLGNSPRTIAFWAKTLSSATQIIFSYGGTSTQQGSTIRAGLSSYGCEGVSFDISYGVVTYSASVTDGQWHHYAYVVPDKADARITDVKVYMDGMLLSDICASDYSNIINTPSTHAIDIGRYTSDQTNYFTGTIDEVALYDRALSSEEIKQIYCFGCVDDSNLVGYWDFDEEDGQIVYDRSGNNNNGRLGSISGSDSSDPLRVISDVPYPTIYYVDDDSDDDPLWGVPGLNVGEISFSDPNENGSCEHAFDSIQKAIDLVNDSDCNCATVIVRDGIYSGAGNYDIDPNGLAVTVQSQNGPDYSIIDCNSQGRAFIFHSGEDANTVLSGLTITGGDSGRDDGSSQSGGAIYCNGTSPTIKDCTIMGNYALWSGGAIYVGPNSRSLIEQCRIILNDCDVAAGGIYSYMSNPVIKNCLIVDNFGYWSGAISSNGYSDSTIINCTIADNLAINGPSGIECYYYTNATVINSILWNMDNIDEQIYLEEGGAVTVDYSDVQTTDGNTWDGNNINADPLFAAPEWFDYHLKSAAGRWTPFFETNGDFNNDGFIDFFDFAIFALSWLDTGPGMLTDLDPDNVVDFRDLAVFVSNWLKPGENISGWVSDSVTSPCIDAGDPDSDYSQEPDPNGGRINMGAYGNTGQASKSP